MQLSASPVEVVSEDLDITLFASREAPKGDFIARRLARTELVVCAAPDCLDPAAGPNTREIWCTTNPSCRPS